MAGFGRVLALLAMALLIVAMVAQIVDVIGRWLMSAPQAWVGDVHQLVLPIVVAACFPLALAERAMVAVELVGPRLGRRADRVLTLFGALALLAVFAVMTLEALRYAGNLARTGRSTFWIGIPLGPTWFAVAALLAVSTLTQMTVLGRLNAAGAARR